MDPRKKKARNFAKAAALLGIELPSMETAPTGQTTSENDSREAEAVLEYVYNPNRFAKKLCNHCGSEFMVDRANVSYCSDKCRAESLEKIGIKWDWWKPPESRWGVRYQGDKLTNEPLVVTGIALEVANQAIEQNPHIDQFIPQQQSKEEDGITLSLDGDIVDDKIHAIMGRLRGDQ